LQQNDLENGGYLNSHLAATISGQNSPRKNESMRTIERKASDTKSVKSAEKPVEKKPLKGKPIDNKNKGTPKAPV
jgi:hypothetical protein